MALAENDIVQLVVNQRYFSKDIVNVFYYGITSVSGVVNVSDVCERFDDAVITNWDENCNEGLTFELIEGRELVREIDIGSHYSGRSGQIAAGVNDRLPAFMALQIKFPRTSQLVRSGFSRFAGIPESGLEGEEWSPSTLAGWENTGAALITVQNVTATGGSCLMAPITVGRMKVDGKYVLDVGTFAARTSYQVMPTPTTQVSRKD